MLKQDTVQQGIAFAILIDLIVWGLYALVALLADITVDYTNLALFFIAFNVLGIRYVIKNKKWDKTGQGMLMATFAAGMLFFVFVYSALR